MISKSLDRLEETIDAENAALLARDLSSVDEFNRRKSQSLLEISRVLRNLKDEPTDPSVTMRLERLRLKLEQNQKTLARYMRAIQEVSAIVSNAIQSVNSDGTYSANVGWPKAPAGAGA